jgi:kynurenine formamidase
MDEATIFWPGGEKFKLCMECCVSEEHGYHYAAGVFSCAEHGGTHVDAPFHFAKDGITVDLIPLQDLIAPCAVLDISAKCAAAGGEYALTAEDIEQHEREHGQIEERSILLVRTGWAQHWRQGAKAYVGFDENTDGPYDSATSNLRFPGIGVDAAHLLISRKVAAVGLDTGKDVTTIGSTMCVVPF